MTTLASRLLRSGSFPRPALYPWMSAAHVNGYPNNYLYTFHSTDGVGWTVFGPTPCFPSTTYRDPSLLFHRGQYWIVATGDGAANSFGLLNSSDPTTGWTHVMAVSTAAASPSNTWAPAWFVDVDGSVHVVVSLNAGGHWRIYEMHPTNDAMTAWSNPVVLNGSPWPSNMIDPNIVLVGSTYYLFYKDEDAATICLATSSGAGPFNGYTVVKTGDWAGWKAGAGGGSIEGPVMVQLADGTWRIYFSQYSSYEANHIYRSETSAADLLSGWSAPTVVSSFDGYNHPEPIRMP